MASDDVIYPTAIVILSDRVSAGEREDGCIPAAREALGLRFEIRETLILPDEPADLQAALIDLCDGGRIALVLTSGGTGLAARDKTPQATAPLLDYEVPGIPEAMRAAVRDRVPTTSLSRAIAGVRGRTLVINLPGSPTGVRESIAAIRIILPHALDLLAGTVGDG